jgi:hypothetical protein
MFDRLPACAAEVGALYDQELKIQNAHTRAEFAAAEGAEVDRDTAMLAARYEAVADNTYGLEVLGMAAMMLPGGRACDLRICPIMRDIALRREHGQGGSSDYAPPHDPGG